MTVTTSIWSVPIKIGRIYIMNRVPMPAGTQSSGGVSELWWASNRLHRLHFHHVYPQLLLRVFTVTDAFGTPRFLKRAVR